MNGGKNKTEIIIREILPKDYQSITDLIVELGYPSTLKEVTGRLDKITKEDNYKTLVAEIRGEAVGFIGLCKLLAYEESGCYVRIIALVVNEQYRNYGIGTEFIHSAERWARSKGASGMAVDSGIHRKEAHVFYTHRGYNKQEYGFGKLL